VALPTAADETNFSLFVHFFGLPIPFVCCWRKVDDSLDLNLFSNVYWSAIFIAKALESKWFEGVELDACDATERWPRLHESEVLSDAWLNGQNMLRETPPELSKSCPVTCLQS